MGPSNPASSPRATSLLGFFSSAPSPFNLQDARPHRSLLSPPPTPSNQQNPPQRAGWETHWTPPALTSQGSLQSTVSAQDDSEWMRHRAPMSCGRRVVHSLVAATLVAHWPQDGGASLPFPPLTLTPGADLRGGESNTKHQKTRNTNHLCSVFLSLFQSPLSF